MPHRARKRYGQHFLEPAWAEKVLGAIAPAADHTFLEIGAGRGALTYPLAGGAAHVIAFEIDRDLAGGLRAAAPPNVRVEEGDFLAVTADRVRTLLAEPVAPSGPVRVAGNLPYNVAAPILFKLVELVASSAPLADATVMVQREVARRLTAAPGSRDFGVLSVLIGYRAAVETLLALPPGAFRPVPKVNSTLVRLRFHQPEPPARDEAIFTNMVRAIFTRRRKTIANALLAFSGARDRMPEAVLAEAAIDRSRRPETLSREELVRLADAFASKTA